MDTKPYLLVLLFVFLTVSVQARITITGTVVLEDEAPLPTPALVQLKCNNMVLQAVKTSSHGRFTFTWGKLRGPSAMDVTLGGVPRGTTAGAGRSTPFRHVDLSGCKCEASLPDYQAKPVPLGIRSPFEDPDIGVITLYPSDSGMTEETIEITITVEKPKEAMEAYQKAQKELSEERVDYSKVTTHLTRAIDIYPKFAEAWQLLGQTCLVEGKEAEARNAFQRALTADPTYFEPYVSLAELELRANHPEEAAHSASQAIKINPYLIGAHYLYAVAKYYLGQMEEAEKSIRAVQESSEAHLYSASHHLLGSIYAGRGDYNAAEEEFRIFLETNPAENVALEVEKTLENWEKGGLIGASGSK